MIKLPDQDSQNRKLGSNVRATYREVGPTCPGDCKHLQSKSCYALYNFVGMHARKSEYHKTDAERIKEYIVSLPEGKKIRHHVSGDFMKPGDEVDTDYINAVLEGHEIREDLQGWSYTHAWERLDSSKMNSTDSLTVNASCDNFDDVFRAREKGWPATVTVGEDQQGGYIEKDGQKARLVICPNQTHDLKCAECKICFTKNREAVVAFRVHGAGKAKFS